MKKTIKIVGVIVCLLVLLYILFLNLPKILGLITKDIVVVDETGLELNIESIPDSDNGFINLQKAVLLIYKPIQATGTPNIISDLYSGKNLDEKLAEDIVNKNEQSLLEFSNIALKNKFQNTAYNNTTHFSPDLPLPSLNNLRTLSMVSSIKSQTLLNKGKNNEAMEEAIKSVKVGQLITDSNITLIEYLVGIAIKKIGLDTIEKVKIKSNFTATELSNYSSELSKMFDTKTGLRSAFIIEHRMREYQIDQFMSELKNKTFELLQEEFLSGFAGDFPGINSIDIKNFYYYRPNKNKQLDADYALEQIKNLNMSCDNIINIKQPKKLTPTNFVVFYLTENVIGKIYHDAIYSSLSSLYQKRCDTDAKLSNIINLLK
jgi:uncharacterized protein (UPF0305 family)